MNLQIKELVVIEQICEVKKKKFYLQGLIMLRTKYMLKGFKMQK